MSRASLATQHTVSRNDLVRSIEKVQLALDQLRGSSDHWTGKLSTSALSTATAVSALSVCLKQVDRERLDSKQSHEDPKLWSELIRSGARWLADSQNDDGGFGDTDRSLSNIATTLLAIAAFELSGSNANLRSSLERAWKYVDRNGSWNGLQARYGRDKTFVVPIMTNCAIAGLVDWKQIPALPFEAAALPQSWYRFARMPVVSYAIPALVAIGQAIHHHAPHWNPFIRSIRNMASRPTLNVLERMQPTSGGYLEAIPLTSFVLMSLASIGQGNSRVASECRKFVVQSVLRDSDSDELTSTTMRESNPHANWPIDTNLAGWVTSLAANTVLDDHSNRDQDRIIDWLLLCQHEKRHPFTGAEPGGWGWTNLSGAVPDADDTPAALLALSRWWKLSQARRDGVSTCLSEQRAERVLNAAALGCRWLVRLQNRDGGWPTFCRGWGVLPFDRSGSDLTAHAIRALRAWHEVLLQQNHLRISTLSRQIDRAIASGWKYLEQSQIRDGSWTPLWFGNQDRDLEDNPVYGTGRVLLCFNKPETKASKSCQRGRQFLLNSQNSDGGWGGGATIHYGKPELGRMTKLFSERSQGEGSGSSTIEETAVAIEGLLESGSGNACEPPIMAGLSWLCRQIESDHHRVSQPIGFYFAKLWYHEQMYPMVFSLAALKKGLEFCQR